MYNPLRLHTRFLCQWDSPGKNTGVGCHFLFQEIFPTQGSNLGLLHCRQILYHLSHSGSQVNYYYLLFILYVFYTMEVILDNKQIWAIFLFKFKMGHKAVEITHNINDTFSPGTANERIVQWRFKKFCKGDESLENEELSGQPLQVDNNQLRAIIQAESSYNYMRSCRRTKCWPFYGHLAFEVNWKGEKLVKWVSQIKEVFILNCYLLLFYTKTVNHSSVGLSCAMKSGFYMTARDNQPHGRTEKNLQSTSQSRTCTQKKVMVTV